MPDATIPGTPVVESEPQVSVGGTAVVRAQLFFRRDAVTGPDAVRAFLERATFSVLTHLVALALLIVVVIHAPVERVVSQRTYTIPSQRIVWLNQEGPGGGGGGGGNRMQAPPRKAELPGRDKVTVPASRLRPQPVAQLASPDTPPLPGLDIPAMTTADASLTVPGSIDSLASSLSQGPGGGGGSGTGTGTGIGPGSGSGLGPGRDGGTGDGPLRPGSGIENPRVLLDVKPHYTAEGMRARIEGSVVMECVVLADGSVGQVSVVKSLDPVFGLDREAIKAARQWRFAPARKLGHPVPVFVYIALDFNLR